jgi:hypothetical protein
METRVRTFMEANPLPLTGKQMREQRIAQRLADASAWRARMKPYFDSLYGPDEWAEDRRLGPTRKQVAAAALKEAA